MYKKYIQSKRDGKKPSLFVIICRFCRIRFKAEQPVLFRAAADVEKTAKRYGGTTIAVGEMQNSNAFEMALALTQHGFVVKEIYASVSPYDFAYIRRLEALSPDTEVYSNLSPSMLYYEGGDHPVELTIGKDAAYYHDDAAHVFWDEEIQPFGYDGLRELLRQISAALEGRTAR